MPAAVAAAAVEVAAGCSPHTFVDVPEARAAAEPALARRAQVAPVHWREDMSSHSDMPQTDAGTATVMLLQYVHEEECKHFEFM